MKAGEPELTRFGLKLQRTETAAAVVALVFVHHATVGAEGDLRFLAPEGTIVAALH